MGWCIETETSTEAPDKTLFLPIWLVLHATKGRLDFPKRWWSAKDGNLSTVLYRTPNLCGIGIGIGIESDLGPWDTKKIELAIHFPHMFG